MRANAPVRYDVADRERSERLALEPVNQGYWLYR